MSAAMSDDKGPSDPSREVCLPDSKYSDQPDSDCPDLDQISGITVLTMALASGIRSPTFITANPCLGKWDRPWASDTRRATFQFHTDRSYSRHGSVRAARRLARASQS